MLATVAPLDEDDLVPDLAQGARVESESAVERRRIELTSGGQELSVLEMIRAPDALADDETHRVCLRGDVAGVAPEHSLELGAEPGRGWPERWSLVQTRLPLARSDHAFGKHAELSVERLRPGRDTP